MEYMAEMLLRTPRSKKIAITDLTVSTSSFVNLQTQFLQRHTYLEFVLSVYLVITT
jgi:hypothetical protein